MRRCLPKSGNALLTFINEQEPVKMADLAANFPEVSTSTIKNDLQLLRKLEKIEKIGERKSTIYISKK